MRSKVEGLNGASWSQLIEAGFCLWVDAGLRRPAEARLLVETGVAGIVVGLETLAGPQALAEIVAEHGDRVLFSLDLQHGIPLGDRAGLGSCGACGNCRRAVEMGVSRAAAPGSVQVGVGAGTGTEDLCSGLAHQFPDLELVAGGGIRGLDDLRRLRGCGVRTVLLASALHDGRITRTEWQQEKDEG